MLKLQEHYQSKNVIRNCWWPTMAQQSVQQGFRISLTGSFNAYREADVRYFNPIARGVELRWPQSQPFLLAAKRFQSCTSADIFAEVDIYPEQYADLEHIRAEVY